MFLAGESLKDFSKYITDIESERDRMVLFCLRVCFLLNIMEKCW